MLQLCGREGRCLSYVEVLISYRKIWNQTFLKTLSNLLVFKFFLKKKIT